jgi:hypothetical protein
MPIVYSAQALRQPYVPPAPKIEAPKPHLLEKPKPVDRRWKVTDETIATIKGWWGKPLAEIAKATGITSNYVSALAKRLKLPSRKRAPRHIGLRPSERDDRLREAWAQPGLTMQERATFAGFAKPAGARRRAKQLNLGVPA